MATKIKVDIVKDYDLLTVFYDNDTKTDELPQTTDSSAVEALINSVKVSEWDFKLFSISIDTMRMFIFKDTFPSATQEFEEIDYTALTVPQKSIVDSFIALL